MIRTLVVDDDYRVADLHCAYVDRVAGFEVAGRAHTGATALESVDQLRPDLVLLDIYLPDISGLEVLQQLREDDHPPVDVLAITAAREVESLRTAMRGGVVHYLIKPFLFPAFEEKLLSYAAARERMARIGHAEQGDVDRIFGALRTVRNESLPKGAVGRHTRVDSSGTCPFAVGPSGGCGCGRGGRQPCHRPALPRPLVPAGPG